MADMIVLKDKAELELMREAGKIAAAALVETGERIKDGVTTADLDKFIRHFIEKHGATPSFLNYQGFPASACISVNEEVIHGIPSKDRIIREGDIVTIDVGAFKKGYHSDTAYTFYCGEVSEEAKRLCEVGRIDVRNEEEFDAALCVGSKRDIRHCYVRFRHCFSDYLICGFNYQRLSDC